MDPEHSALPQPPAVPAPQRSSQKPVSAHLLPSPMTSLTEPAAPNSIDVNRGASEPAAQYPSLDAAVAQAQPLVPTLSNLLALQVTPGKIGGGAATPLQGFSPSLAGFGGDQPIPSVSAPRSR
ncbi:MAG: hypothetical protein HC824_06405 [Synechococcales cyanobacterium RM1_1_8]|nr:hypothetical protein [Synechococcales cyanobacterium RM1_1_8]